MFESDSARVTGKRQSVYHRMDGTDHSESEPAEIAEKNKDAGIKETDAKNASSGKPRLGPEKENSRSSLLDSVPSPVKASPRTSTGKSAQEKTEKSIGNSGVHSDGYLEMLLRAEKLNSWVSSESTESGDRKTLGEKNGVDAQGKKSPSASKAALAVHNAVPKSPASQPLLRAPSGNPVNSSINGHSVGRQEEESSLIGSSSDEPALKALPPRPPNGKATPGKKKRARNSTNVPAQPNRNPTGFLVPIEVGRPRNLKERGWDLRNSGKVYAYIHEMITLMTGPSDKDTAEELYQLIVEICTDKDLGDIEKLMAILGKYGKTCKTVNKNVNDFFDAWIIDSYAKNHLSKKHPARGGQSRANNNDQKSLLTKDDDDDADQHGDFLGGDKNQEKDILCGFEKSLGFLDRWRLGKLKIPEKYAGNAERKAAFRRDKLIRMMHQRLSPEERQTIKTESKKYYDLLTNSGLPVLHIAIKNESCELVKAYLHAVMAFAPPNVKVCAIEARQHQALPAFYYAMTHSTTTMIETFMETILESNFLYIPEKEKIILARRPDPDPTGTFGVGGFYLAMAMGDKARSEAYMRQVYEWDTNCEFKDIAESKVEMLLANKSWFIGDTARGALTKFGHRRLAKLYGDFVNSSRLDRAQKNELYFADAFPVPEKLRPQASLPPPPTPQEIAELEKILGIPEKKGRMPEPMVQGNELFFPISRAERGLLLEREVSFRKQYGMEPLPHLTQKPYKDLCLLTITDFKKAGNYASFATLPPPIRIGRRVDEERDEVFGLPPRESQECRANRRERRARNNTLPPRSGSYSIELTSLPSSPSSVSVVETLDVLSPVKLSRAVVSSWHRQLRQVDSPIKLLPPTVPNTSQRSMESRSGQSKTSPGRRASITEAR